ncbi:MAG TPA: ATP-binding protein [Rubrivivax sp.]|nr:ATP-binding protein [Rubrivivax sp.]
MVDNEPAPSETRPPTAILADIAAGLSTGRDLPELLRQFLAPVMRLAGAQGGAVRVLSASGERLDLVSAIGLSSEMCRQERSVDRHCGFCGAAADGSPVVWAPDLSDCHTRHGATLGAGTPAQRMLALPLQHRGRVLGVYNLFFAGGGEPAPDVQALLRSVGELLGLALDNARLEAENLEASLARERQRMAAEVHDSLAQSLAFVKMRMPLLEDALRGCEQERAMRYCADVRGAVSQAHASLRGLLTHFRSPMDPQGLVHALEAAAHRFRDCSSAELDFVNELPGLKLGPDEEAQVFHIVQEALSNVARHASARHARLQVAGTPLGGVDIVVEDDGAGLPAATAGGGSHYGLEIMLERARRLGGTLQIGAREGGGTRVHLAIPAGRSDTGAAVEAR